MTAENGEETNVKEETQEEIDANMKTLLNEFPDLSKYQRTKHGLRKR